MASKDIIDWDEVAEVKCPCGVHVSIKQTNGTAEKYATCGNSRWDKEKSGYTNGCGLWFNDKNTKWCDEHKTIKCWCLAPVGQHKLLQQKLLCDCNRLGRVFTSKKTGKNFIKCGKPKKLKDGTWEDSCKFWKWEDDLPLIKKRKTLEQHVKSK